MDPLPVEGAAANAGEQDAELLALREKVQLLQQIQNLQNAVALPLGQATVPKNVKVPEGRYTMSLSEYRTYSKDCIDYKTLTGLNDNQIVLQMRLNMDNDLKVAIDTNFPEWRTNTVEDAIKNVGVIVNQISNQAVYRKQFHNMTQTEEEPIREFCTRLRTLSTDCLFICPFDETHDLTDTYIIDQIRSGVHDMSLQQELLQRQSTLNTLPLIVQYCEDFESAKRDKEKLHDGSSTRSIVGALGSVSDHPEIGASYEEIVAALSMYRKSRNGNQKGKGGGKCRNCGDSHERGKCSAYGKTCLRCGKRNHLARVCHSNVPNEATTASILGAIIIATMSKTTDSLARVSLVVGVGCVDRPQTIDAIPDTGAEVTVAGECFLVILGIKKKHLVPPSQKLKHVAGGQIEVLGCCQLSLECWGTSIIEKVFFIANITNMFLSLDALKKLRIIHKEFPLPIDGPSMAGRNEGRALPQVSYVHTAQEPDPQVQGTTDDGGTESEVLPQVSYVHTAQESVNSRQSVHGSSYMLNSTGNLSKSLIRGGAPPFAPIEQNIPLLKKYLIGQFKDVFDKSRIPFPAMKGKDLHIHLVDTNVEPYAVHTPVPVAFHLEQAVDELLENWMARQIIIPVGVGEPVNWCTRAVVVLKKDGSLRLTVDFQELNKNIKRETHHSPRPFDAVCAIPSHSYKTVLDAKDGYSQVKLDEESSLLTTFITFRGRFRFLRAPQGLKSSGDAYTRRFDEVLVDVKDKVKIIDDTLLHDQSILDSFHHVVQFLQTCRENDVTLNEKKFMFCCKQLEFAGFNLGWERYTPSDDILKAISNFPMPENPTLTDIRAWFGLVNQLAPFFATSKVMTPFRELLQSNSKTVYWDSHLQEIFETSRKSICEAALHGLKYFNTRDRLSLQTDWSKKGIGFVLFQQTCSCESKIPGCCIKGWQLTFCNSRFLQPSETNYCPLEGEALAVAWALKKSRMFLLGCPGFMIQTDHKPLVPILNDKALSSIDNPRLIGFKEKTLPYSFEIQHLVGEKMFAADTLSRYPVGKADSEDVELADELNVASIRIVSSIAHSSDTFGTSVEDIREAAALDEQYQLLLETVSDNKFASTRETEHNAIKEFYHVRDRLSVVDGLLTYTFDCSAPRLIVPRALRSQVIKNIHAAHQGRESILARTRNSVYWPGITNDIITSCESCPECQKMAPSQPKEPLVMTKPPEYPFQQAVADLFSKNSTSYLAYACRLTAWLEVAHFPSSVPSREVIKVLREFFHRFGIPEEISLDGGPNLDSLECLEFLKSWGVARRLSSAYYAQSNGRAEVAVKTAKRILTGNTGPRGSLNTDAASKALMQYRNTPIKGTDTSPAQLLLGRSIRDSVPQPPSAYKVSAKWQQMLRQREKSMSKSADTSHQETSSRRTLDVLTVGTEVLIQNAESKRWDRSGMVVEVCPFRQYKVKVHGSGRYTIRNRIHLKPLLVFRPTTTLQKPPPVGIPSLPPTAPPTAPTSRADPTSDSASSTGPSSYASAQSSSYAPSSADYAHQSTDRSRSPLIQRRSTRERNEPDRYGEWTR